MKVSEALRAAMALIEDESRWCRDYLALSAAGFACNPSDEEAALRCADGALCCVTGCDVARGSRGERLSCAELYRQCACHLDEASYALFDGLGFITVNDVIGHAAIMKCYRAAIGCAEAEEAKRCRSHA